MHIKTDLRQKGKEIVGQVELEGDAAFMLEALLLTIETFAEKYGVQASAVIQDLYSMQKGRVK